MTPEQIQAQVSAIEAAQEQILSVVGAIAAVWAIIKVWGLIRRAVNGPGDSSKY